MASHSKLRRSERDPNLTGTERVSCGTCEYFAARSNWCHPPLRWASSPSAEWQPDPRATEPDGICAMWLAAVDWRP